MVVAEYPSLSRRGLLEKRQCGVVRAEAGIHLTDGGLEPALNVRLIAQRLLDLTRASVQNLPGGDEVAAGLGWIRGLEQTDQEFRYLFRSGRFLIGAIALLRDASGLDGRHGCKDSQECHQHAGRRDTHAMTAGELAHAIRGARRPGQDWFIHEMATDINRQRVGRGVTTRPILFEGSHRDPVEVAPQQARKSGWSSRSMLGRAVGRRTALDDDGARPRRVFLANRPANFVDAGLA